MASALTAPPAPAAFAALPLSVRNVKVSRLVRISRFSSGEPFFGRAGANRFDDPSQVFGTCYLGFDLPTAFAETALHDEVAVSGRFAVVQSDLDSRHIVTFATDTVLTLANLTGASLKTLGADGAISTVIPFDLPQRWSAAIHAHPAAVDGLYYVSRQLNDRRAVVVFDRASAKLQGVHYAPLASSRGLAHVRRLLHVDVVLP